MEPMRRLLTRIALFPACLKFDQIRTVPDWLLRRTLCGVCDEHRRASGADASCRTELHTRSPKAARRSQRDVMCLIELMPARSAVCAAVSGGAQSYGLTRWTGRSDRGTQAEPRARRPSDCLFVRRAFGYKRNRQHLYFHPNPMRAEAWPALV